jgi:UDP-N-acetylglucosamine 2-epimerase (non-hydrolysing)
MVHLVAAARPNFMKIAPLFHALVKEDWCELKIVHTGQHYDSNMSAAFFRDLSIPLPDFDLGVGSGTHAEQTGGVMIAYERVCFEHRPDWIVVVGDVNSTAACALVGAKMWIPVIHLEAGLRSHDRQMPEEINRRVTDAICEVLWTPSPDADENLAKEGIGTTRIDQVGNIMIDSYEMLRDQIAAAATRSRLIPAWSSYGVVTLHRPSNVDTKETLSLIVDQLVATSRDLPLIFPVHPRTRSKLVEFKLLDRLERGANLRFTEPLGYVEFMNLVTGAAVVVTDSGGVQEETTYLRIPCLTVRENTERPITLTQGSNRLVKPSMIAETIKFALSGAWSASAPPANWDGHTANRCVEALKRRIHATVGRTDDR